MPIPIHLYTQPAGVNTTNIDLYRCDPLFYSSTRKYIPFVMQRISVAVQIAAASEIRQALGRGMGPDSA